MDEFNRQHRYSIKYNYGLEASKRDWDPHSCGKIISNAPECSCPFKALNPISLESKLKSYNIDAKGVLEIISSCRKEQYTIACTKYFEITHKMTPKKGINNPNQYFDNSFEISSISRNTLTKYKDDPFHDDDDNDDYIHHVAERSDKKVKSIIDVNGWHNDDFHKFIDQISNV